MTGFLIKKTQTNYLFSVHGFSCPHAIQQIVRAVKNNYRKWQPLQFLSSLSWKLDFFLNRYTTLPLKKPSFKYANNHSSIVVLEILVNTMFQQSLNVFFRFGMKHSNKVISQLYRTLAIWWCLSKIKWKLKSAEEVQMKLPARTAT